MAQTWPLQKTTSIRNTPGLSTAVNQSVGSLSPRRLLSNLANAAGAMPACWISGRAVFNESTFVTVPANGGAILYAQDLSGNGMDAVQTTTANEPKLVTGTRPGIDFSADSARNLTITGLFASQAGFSTGFSGYFVISGVAGYPGGIQVIAAADANNYLAINTSTVDAKAIGNQITNGSAPHDALDLNGVWSYVFDPVNHTLRVGINGCYFSIAAAGSALTSGDYVLGNLSTTLGLSGKIHEFVCWPGAHSQTVSDSISANLAADSGLVLPGFVFPGTSITLGSGLTSTSAQCYPAQLMRLLGLTNGTNVRYENFGIAGETYATMITDAGTQSQRLGYLSSVRGNQNILCIDGPTNDMSASGDGVTAGIALTRTQTLVSTYRAGYSGPILLHTVLPRVASNAGAGFEAARLAYNPALLAWASTQPNVYVSDWGADPLMGPVGSLSNTTLYQSDQIHPTREGAARLALIDSYILGTLLAT